MSFRTKPSHLLTAAANGDRQAATDLLPLVYDELRKLAAARMVTERPGHTLDATALVHEAYLRLVGDQHFDGKALFFAATAEAMRRVLVNHARDCIRVKRGGGRNRVDLDRLTSPPVATDADLLELDVALDRLATDLQRHRPPAPHRLPMEQAAQGVRRHSTVHRWFQRWCKNGVMERVWAMLVSECDELGAAAWDWQAVDGTMGKARFWGTALGQGDCTISHVPNSTCSR